MSPVDKHGEGDVNDFSCYIRINNNSNYDLGLVDFGTYGEGGQWRVARRQKMRYEKPPGTRSWAIGKLEGEAETVDQSQDQS
jgi:hypothetical protein